MPVVDDTSVEMVSCRYAQGRDYHERMHTTALTEVSVVIVPASENVNEGPKKPGKLPASRIWSLGRGHILSGEGRLVQVVRHTDTRTGPLEQA